MVSRWRCTYRYALALVGAPTLMLAGLSLASTAPASAGNRSPAAFTVRPNPTNNLDCNGWSRAYQPLMPAHRTLCTDPAGPQASTWASRDSYRPAGRFVDNGHYVGHDEPSVKFISHSAGSGNTMTYYLRLPRNPAAAPTPDGSVTTYGELSVAPWFGLPLCDPSSYPLNRCRPHSDRNSGNIRDPHAAGSAFMELQLYPPGFAPFQDNVSCDATRWCSALTIDSLESDYGFRHVNPDCTEPVNFAYLQTNGVPAGPPSPQRANARTQTPNRHTLMMHGGDLLMLTITDPLHGRRAGFTTAITDLTTGRAGYMVASARNGFMDTNFRTCKGRPWTFHAEYATARAANSVPWALLDGGVLMQQETGHAEICQSLSNPDPVHLPGFSDPSVQDTCAGGAGEPDGSLGEGPCDLHTGDCIGATTQDGQACPSANIASGNLCEYADGYCVPAGPRTVQISGHPVRETSPVNFCAANRFQNGDLDFDGTPYQTGSWPDGGRNHPTSFRYIGPFDRHGQLYPTIQFESNAPGSEALCHIRTGAGCTVPPAGADFYPFWSLTSKQGLGHDLFRHTCTWNFGARIAGVTTKDFGQDRQYGHPEFSRIPLTLISAQRANPQLRGCRRP